MTELDDSLPPGEQHILNELTEAKWAHERSLLEWKALYAGEGKEPSERQMYEDVKKVLSSDTPADDVLPTVEPAEKLRRARLVLHTFQKLSNTLEMAKTEWSYNRDVLNEELRRLRSDEEEA